MITVLISPLEFCHMQKFLHLACLWQPNWLQTYGFFRRAPAGTFTTQRENPFRRAARRLTRTGRQPDPIDNRWGQTVQNLRENPLQRAERQTAGTQRQPVRSNSTQCTTCTLYSITVLQWLICLGLAPQVEDLTRPVVQRREAPGMEIR